MTDFAPLPQGQVSWSVVLPDHQMQLGLQHREGAGLRVVVWDGTDLRHMSPARAKRWAKELEESDYALAFKPVIAALVSLGDRAEGLLAKQTVH